MVRIPLLLLMERQQFADAGVADSTYLDGHAAAIYLSVGGEAQRIGTFGILHPKVLRMFELPFPTSTLEINVEVFL